MTLWEMVKELHDMVLEGEIDITDELLTGREEDFDAGRFIISMFQNLSEEDDQATEETTKRQRATIHQLWNGYCNDDWRSLEEYL